MDIELKPSGGMNIVLRPGALPSYYPEPTAQAAMVEVYWRYGASETEEPEPPSANRLIGVFRPGQEIEWPYNPDSDRDVIVSTISISASGVRSAESAADAVQATVLVRRETEAPEVAQSGASTAYNIRLVITGFTKFANKRRLRISESADMTDAQVFTTDAATERLSNIHDIAREVADPVLTNFALAANGGEASASAADAPNFPSSNCNDGSRVAPGWNSPNPNGGWQGGDESWLQIEFDEEKLITEIDVITLQDNPVSTVPPTLAMTFSNYGLTDFEAQYWNGSAWVTAPGANIVGNNKVWRQIVFDEVTTTKIRVLCHDGLAGLCRLVEVEAWGPESQALPETIYVAVSHSSGMVWGAESEPLELSFADGNNEGGTTGEGDPFVPLKLDYGGSV